jgi:hypothetical protein
MRGGTYSKKSTLYGPPVFIASLKFAALAFLEALFNI